jgi:opacity protein-like surface antigen
MALISGSHVVRSLGRVLLAFVGLIAAIPSAFAQTPWYIEGSAGAIWRGEYNYSTTIFNAAGLTGPGTNTDFFNPGPVLNLGVGYKLPFGFRAEVEGGLAYYTLAGISPLSTNGLFPALVGTRLNQISGGIRDQYSGTVNVFYDLPSFGRVVPYVGGGAGAEYLAAETGVFGGPGVPRFTQLGTDQTHAVVLAEGGVAVNVNSNWSVVPAYRFESALRASGPSLNANIFKIGVRYSPEILGATPVLVHK